MSIAICSFLRLLLYSCILPGFHTLLHPLRITDSHTVTQPLKHAAAELPPHGRSVSHSALPGYFQTPCKSQGSASLVPHDAGNHLPPTCTHRPHQDNLSHILLFGGTLEHFLRNSCCNRADVPVLLNTFSEKSPPTYTPRLLFCPLLNTFRGKAGMRVRRLCQIQLPFRHFCRLLRDSCFFLQRVLFTSPGLPGGFSLSLSVVLPFWYALPPPGRFSLKCRFPGILPVFLPDTQGTERTAGSYMVH